jgi:hypothetical protein
MSDAVVDFFVMGSMLDTFKDGVHEVGFIGSAGVTTVSAPEDRLREQR